MDTALQFLCVEDFAVYQRLAELLRDGVPVEMITDEE